MRFGNLLPLLVLVKFIGCQLKVGHKGLHFPFRYPGHLAHDSDECFPVYSVFYNCLILVTGINVMRGGEIGWRTPKRCRGNNLALWLF